MLCSSFLPITTGSVRVVYDLSRKMALRKHDVYVLTRLSSNTKRFEIINNFNVIRVPPSGTSILDRVSFLIIQILEAFRQVRKMRFDVVHVHGFLSMPAGIFCKFTQNIPLVVTLHGSFWIWPTKLRWHSEIFNKITKKIEKILLRRTDAILAQTLSIKDFLINLYGSEIRNRIQVIPNGVDTEQFYLQSTDSSSNESAKHQFAILYVGKLMRIKGIDILLKAAKPVVEKFPNSIFIILGQGPMKNRLMSLAEELNISNFVNFEGVATGEKLRRYYNMADIVVLPSYAEFFGLVLLEAMAMHKPVVSTKTIGPKDIIVDGENGLLVDVGNPHQLATALIRLLSDGNFAKLMGIKGSQLVREKYDINIIVDQHERLYKLLIGQRNKKCFDQPM